MDDVGDQPLPAIGDGQQARAVCAQLQRRKPAKGRIIGRQDEPAAIGELAGIAAVRVIGIERDGDRLDRDRALFASRITRLRAAGGGQRQCRRQPQGFERHHRSGPP